jgi:hypothetical protein
VASTRKKAAGAGRTVKRVSKTVETIGSMVAAGAHAVGAAVEAVEDQISSPKSATGSRKTGKR